MKPKTYRAHCKDENQNMLFPMELDTATEFWFDWQEKEIISIQNAMLKQAIAEVRDRRKSQTMRQEAWQWLMNDEDTPFAARLCAENNGYDIDVLRTMLKRLVTDIE